MLDSHKIHHHLVLHVLLGGLNLTSKGWKSCGVLLSSSNPSSFVWLWWTFQLCKQVPQAGTSLGKIAHTLNLASFTNVKICVLCINLHLSLLSFSTPLYLISFLTLKKKLKHFMSVTLSSQALKLLISPLLPLLHWSTPIKTHTSLQDTKLP